MSLQLRRNMIALSDKRFYWIVTALFVFAAAHFTLEEHFWIYFVPVALLVGLLLLLRMDVLFFITVLIVPFSIDYDNTPLGIGVNFPTEPVTFCLMLVVLFKLITQGGIEKHVLLHPVSIFILLHLLWMFVTTLTSQMPLVSFKYTLARFSFVMVFYFYAIQVFSRTKNIFTFLWLYIISFSGVIIYTTINHAAAHFTEQAAHSAMTPFYYDHTQYAAVIAMFIPVVCALVFASATRKRIRVAAFAVFVLLLTGLVLSYTRASWLSIAVMLLCSGVFIFRVKTSLVWGGILIIATIISLNYSAILLSLETNRKASSTDFASHVQSISNIKTDASNTERLNRWSCAIRMFYQRPVTGWGPGTYQFLYGPFQLNSEMTYISTTHGDRGNAHSEYLGPLSEQGFLGPILFIAIAFTTLISSSRFIIRTRSKSLRAIAIGLLLGLITYWVHGFLNNFLYTEKASIPYWGFIASLVALQVYHSDVKSDTAVTVIKET